MFIFPVMRDHLSWETTEFNGRIIHVSLYYFIQKNHLLFAWKEGGNWWPIVMVLYLSVYMNYSDHSAYVLSQWGKALHINASSHWLSPYPEWFLTYVLFDRGLRYIQKCMEQTPVDTEGCELKIGFKRNHYMCSHIRSTFCCARNESDTQFSLSALKWHTPNLNLPSPT